VTTGDPYADWDAAYVLGMLGPADRREFEGHLAGCAACTAAVAELAGMPGILSALSRDEALALDADPTGSPAGRAPAPGPFDRMPAAPRSALIVPRPKNSGPRFRRALLASVAVLLLVGVGIGLGRWVLPSSADGSAAAAPAAIAMTPVRPGTMTADLRVITKAWGTRFEWTCDYLDTSWAADGSSPVYLLVVTDLAGTETPVATWSATGHAAGGLVASTSVPTAQIRSVDIRTAADAAPLVLAHL